ncbi:cytochrome P450 [Trametes polyzona]|nr:cytochrome P450 [Trametes polyzona]
MPSALVLLTCSLAIVIVFAQRSRQSGRHLPPGPKRLPLVGNIFDVTFKEFWLRVTSWAEQYGDVVYLSIFGQGLLFLNSMESTSDLLEKRGALYSDRPPSTMLLELCGCEDIIAFARYENPSYRRHHRLLHRVLAPARMPSYHPAITAEVLAFLQNMVHSPGYYVGHIRRFASSQIMSIVYGYKVAGAVDPYVGMADESLHIISNEILAVGNVWLVDIFPFLKHIPAWFPGAGFKRKAQVWRAGITECADRPFEWFKERFERGTATLCYCTSLLAECEAETSAGRSDPDREADIRWTASAMYIASVDTTLVLVLHLILALVQYSEVARKARKELDAVIGSSRLPTFEDRPALPYIEAVLSECMRWTAPVPLGLPHRLMQDDVYRGMTIPRGTLVFGNIWKMSRDPALFANPDEFIPERYLEEVDEATARRRDPRNFVFGFGRRACLGNHIVESYLWLVVAGMLATLDFDKATDENGNVIDSQPEYNDASFRLATPFPCIIRPRSQQTRDLIQESLSGVCA